jgi:hypothetical protein
MAEDLKEGTEDRIKPIVKRVTKNSNKASSEKCYEYDSDERMNDLQEFLSSS